jgi:hypothetical protein
LDSIITQRFQTSIKEKAAGCLTKKSNHIQTALWTVSHIPSASATFDLNSFSVILSFRKSEIN